ASLLAEVVKTQTMQAERLGGVEALLKPVPELIRTQALQGERLASVEVNAKCVPELYKLVKEAGAAISGVKNRLAYIAGGAAVLIVTLDTLKPFIARLLGG
ncbi:MAG: hypothetical protein AB1896_22125, partial [Thermodesulfobacteriota bacterium]